MMHIALDIDMIPPWPLISLYISSNFEGIFHVQSSIISSV
jgi:hypothetical protein